MNVAKLNRRLIIESLTTAADGAGGLTGTWATLATVWASINPVNPQRLFEIGKEFQGIAYQIVMHFNDASGITDINNFRIKHGTRYLKIHKFWNTEDDKLYTKILAIDG